MMVEEVDRLVADENCIIQLTGGSASPKAEAPVKLTGRYYSWPTQDDYSAYAAKGLQLCHDKDIERVKLMFNSNLHKKMIRKAARQVAPPLARQRVPTPRLATGTRGSTNAVARSMRLAMTGIGVIVRGMSTAIGEMSPVLGENRNTV